MATDLSIPFQEAITSTIETSLSSGGVASVESLHKVDSKILKGKNVLVVNSTFTFEKLTTNVKFLLPAQTATKIAHAMLMEDTPPLDTISEDIADAMKESTTQICGTLQTVFNGREDLEELGKVSFSIGTSEIIDGGTYQSGHLLTYLKLDIEENPFDYFIDFEENFIPYLEEFNNLEELVVNANDNNDLPPSNEEIIDLNASNIDNDESFEDKSGDIAGNDDGESGSKDTDPNQVVSTGESPVVKEDENIASSIEDSEVVDDPQEKKNKKLKLIVMILGGLIATIIITFLVLLFMGTFDKEELSPAENNITKDLNQTTPKEESIVIAEIKKRQIDFKMEMIDTDRINERLKLLTKYEILEEDVLEKYKKAEAERLYKLKMEKLEEFALNNKEKSLYKTDGDGNGSVDSKLKDRFSDGDTEQVGVNEDEKEKAMANESLMFIKIDPKEYKKYKPAVDEHKQNSTQISICKDFNGAVSVYVGPLYLKTVTNNIMNGAKKLDKNSTNDMKIVTIIRSDFNKMCDF